MPVVRHISFDKQRNMRYTDSHGFIRKSGSRKDNEDNIGTIISEASLTRIQFLTVSAKTVSAASITSQTEATCSLAAMHYNMDDTH